MITVAETAALKHDSIVVIDHNGYVWLTFQKSYWNVFGWLRWWLTPGKRAFLLLKGRYGNTIRVRAVRIATSYVQMGK